MKKTICFIIFFFAAIVSIAQVLNNKQEIIIKCPQCGHNIVVSINVNGTTIATHEGDSIANPGRCQATTLKGTQCSRNAVAGSKYCTQHKNMYGNSQGSTSSSSNTSTNSSSTTSGGQCRATTKAGKRCSRPAKSNGYCWQHGG